MKLAYFVSYSFQGGGTGRTIAFLDSELTTMAQIRAIEREVAEFLPGLTVAITFFQRLPGDDQMEPECGAINIGCTQVSKDA